jgi:uncharacterized protein (TIGR00725 family)
VAPRLQLAVVGAAACDDDTATLARAVGAEIARIGAVLVCGGRGGVMAAACAGAKAAGGWTVGVLPGADEADSRPNEDLDVVLYTGLQQARNQIVVLSAGAVIAVGGGWGTLSEIACALKFRVPTVLVHSWTLKRPDGLSDPLLLQARTAADAVALAQRAIERERPVTLA